MARAGVCSVSALCVPGDVGDVGGGGCGTVVGVGILDGARVSRAHDRGRKGWCGMTVAELIEELKRHDQDAVVFYHRLANGHQGYWELRW